MSAKSKFSASEWALVKDAPYWVYQALAKVDGSIAIIAKRKESKALDNAISSYRTTNSLVNELKSNDTPSAHISKSTDAKAHENLAKIAGIVGERLNGRELQSFNLFLMDIANAIAEAAGEGVLGAGEKISKNEAEALEKIESSLNATLQAVQVEERREKADAKRKQSAIVAAKRRETQKKAKLVETRKKEEARKKTSSKSLASASASKHAQAVAKRKAKTAAAQVAAAKAAADTAEANRKKAEAAEQLREKRAAIESKRRVARAKDARAKAVQQAKLKKEADGKAAAKVKWDAEQKIKEDNRKKWMAEQAEKDKWIGEHTVVAGDNLGAISLKYYNSAAKNMWMRIYEANKHIIGANPNMIQIGQKLRIPK